MMHWLLSQPIVVGFSLQICPRRDQLSDCRRQRRRVGIADSDVQRREALAVPLIDILACLQGCTDCCQAVVSAGQRDCLVKTEEADLQLQAATWSPQARRLPNRLGC